MTKEELWTAYTAKNPSFNGNDVIHMSAAGLRKLFDQTWERAHDLGVKNGRALERIEKAQTSPSGADIFAQMFGGRK